MQRSYLDYAMSVIVGRALPDVRDGLKPVHRRILLAANEEGVRRPTVRRKSRPHRRRRCWVSTTRTVTARSTTPWSAWPGLRVPATPLIDGQGNFGTADGDQPAAMRYTEARLNALAMELLRDIDKDTVDFTPNYDN